MNKPSKKHEVNSISFNRLEGQGDEQGERHFDSFAELDQYIRTSAQTAPNNGAYDKCRYVVIWDDNQTYGGRFELLNSHTQGADFIQNQIKSEKLNPKAFNQEESLAWLAARSFEDKAATKEERLDGSQDVATQPTPSKAAAAGDDSIHIWEANNIGQAPFTFKGFFELPSRAVQEANPMAFNTMMETLPSDYPKGSCSICGTAIKNHYMLMDANGQKLVAGSSCINKSGDAGLVSKAREEKNRQARERNFKRAEAERLAKLEAERQANGGLTNYELEEKERADAKAAKLESLEDVISELGPYADRLHDGRGGFRDSICDGLDKGELPKGRGLDLMIEILAKEKGRKNSKKYKAEAAKLTQELDKIAKMIASKNL